ncbi:MAG TPA: hypothetical protein VEC75_12615 [Stellaceae bacterium]|nr:hypothetical protein [Stellaceae bacterium]
MLFHASIDAQDPCHVASVLAEIWRGTALSFPPIRDAFIVLAGDERGSAIEVVPAGHVLIPGDTEAESIEAFETPRATATHLALGVPRTIEEIERIAAREGWLCRVCSRGGLFRVIELWVENRVELELLTPEMQAEYRAAAEPARLRAAFSAAAAMRPLGQWMPTHEYREVANG